MKITALRSRSCMVLFAIATALLFCLIVFLQYADRNFFAYGCRVDSLAYSEQWGNAGDVRKYFASELPKIPRCAKYPVALRRIRQTNVEWLIDVKYGGLNRTWRFWKKGGHP